MTEESKFISYAAVRQVGEHVSKLAIVAIVLAVSPLIVDALLAMESAISNGRSMTVSDLQAMTVIAFFQIAMQITAAGICVAARRRIREAPEGYYRMRWVGTVAAWVCYGILLIEAGLGLIAVLGGT